MVQTEAVKAELELKWPGVRFDIFGMVRPHLCAYDALVERMPDELTFEFAFRPRRATTTRRPRCISLEGR